MFLKQNPDDLPLQLPTVLEEEYVALQGLVTKDATATMGVEYRTLPHPSFKEYPAGGADKDRLTAIYELIHHLPRRRSALCLSGGGIRSATFGLGVLQGLARLKLLDQFDYLSTVSGGGYIGSWLTAWSHRHDTGVAGVAEELGRQPRHQLAPELPTVNWLRRHSNYLSPKLGLLSADSWTLVGTYLRNVILNWSVLVPALLALLALPLLFQKLLRVDVPDWGLATVIGLGGLLLLAPLTYSHLCRPSLADFRPGARWADIETQRAFIWLCLVPLLLGAGLLTLASAWLQLDPSHFEGWQIGARPLVWTFAAATTILHLFAWGLSALMLKRSWSSRWLYLELATIALSGTAGGILLWVALQEAMTYQVIRHHLDWYAACALPAFLSIFLLAATLFVGLASRFTGDQDREWWGRSGSWVLIGSIAWLATAGLVFFGPPILRALPGWVASMGGVAGLITLLLGFSSKTPAQAADGQPNWWTQAGRQLYRLALAPLTVALLLALLAWVNAELIGRLSWKEVGLFILSAGAVSGIMSVFVHINKFSLHSIYRNRLIRAYLGASRSGVRKPNPFTGFDPDDNLQMAELAPDGARLKKPLYVINIALNLVHGRNLAWQQRKAQSFTVTPLHSGSFAGSLGYRRSSQYGRNKGVGQAITLGTALAISGAAASPNMGYHSLPAVTFLLAFFNIRLGWWLGNPGDAGARTYTRSSPLFTLRPLLAEAFGLTDSHNRYVYLSDGGHFENLGLYEMVLRRCHCILVSDAGCDQAVEFQDLGNAIRKIRIDLGIDIDINLHNLRLLNTGGRSEGHYAVGSIHYDRVDPGAPDGILIYLKPVLTGDEPADVREYADHHDQFPHEPTSDQFFDESQFESYRRLGEHITEEVFECAASLSSRNLDAIFQELRERDERPLA
jgi:hypothetical protein